MSVLSGIYIPSVGLRLFLKLCIQPSDTCKDATKPIIEPKLAKQICEEHNRTLERSGE